MALKGDVIQIIYSAVDEINQDLPVDGRLEKSPDAVLLGDAAKLDSLGFINFILIIEENVKKQLGYTVALVTQESMSSPEGPFQTVEKLAEYIIDLKPLV